MEFNTLKKKGMTLNVADISLFKKPDGFHAIWKIVTILSLLLAEHIKIIIFFIFFLFWLFA